MKTGLLIVLAFFGFSEVAVCETAPQSASSTLRRTYPGGRDDSDLTVQVLRKITRKGEEIETHYTSHVEPVEDSAPPPAEQPQGE